jgi:hypothetical protein
MLSFRIEFPSIIEVPFEEAYVLVVAGFGEFSNVV